MQVHKFCPCAWFYHHHQGHHLGFFKNLELTRIVLWWGLGCSTTSEQLCNNMYTTSMAMDATSMDATWSDGPADSKMGDSKGGVTKGNGSPVGGPIEGGSLGGGGNVQVFCNV